MNSNKHSVALFTAALAALTILPETALARQDPPVRKYWFYYRVSYRPNPTPQVTITCDEDRQKILAGFNLRSGLVTFASFNGTVSVSPTVVGELEFCASRYKNQNWAPSRFALETSFGVNPFHDYYTSLNFGAGIRYQMPLVEQVDLGGYLKYTHQKATIISTGAAGDSKHDIVFGFLVEYRPWYEAANMENGGLFTTARIGLGVDYSVAAKKAHRMLEFSLGVGYRFTEF